MKINLFYGVILLQIFAQVNGQDIDPNFCRGKDQPFGAFPHPNITRCDLFVFCAMYMPFLQECPADTIFVPHLAADPPYGECEPGYPDTCQLATPPAITTTSKTSTFMDLTTELDDSTQTTEISELTTDLELSLSTITSRLQTTTPIPIHRCPPGGFGNIPHHTNCSRYFECKKGIRHLRFCPDGLLFDSITLQCTYPELAVCAGKN